MLDNIMIPAITRFMRCVGRAEVVVERHLKALLDLGANAVRRQVHNLYRRMTGTPT